MDSSDGKGTALAFDPNFKLLTGTPNLGSTVIFYATGLGATTPPATSGYGGNISPPFNQVASPFDIYIGGSKATVAWAGLAPGFVGVYQLNVVSSGEAVGDVVIYCSNCNPSNDLQMPQAPLNTGNNTANASGSVTILYPANQPTVTFSPAFVVAKITAQFDIKPNASQFTLSVIAKVGSTIVDGTTIQFDPVLRPFTATVPSPTPSVRTFDFSQTGTNVVDFKAGDCGTNNSCPMPGNIVPISRLDPVLAAALTTVSLPNSPPKGIHSFHTVVGNFTPGSTFVMDSSNNLDLLTFASFGSIPYPTSDVPVSVMLYVDGQMLDAATATYKHP